MKLNHINHSISRDGGPLNHSSRINRLMKDSHTSTDKQSLMNQAVEIINYVHNQRVFLIGKPMVSQFDYLICGYTEDNYGELLKKKINNDKND